MARFSADGNAPPKRSPAEAARLDAMSDDAITAAAHADPDARAFHIRAFHINVTRLARSRAIACGKSEYQLC